MLFNTTVEIGYLKRLNPSCIYEISTGAERYVSELNGIQASVTTEEEERFENGMMYLCLGQGNSFTLDPSFKLFNSDIENKQIKGYYSHNGQILNVSIIRSLAITVNKTFIYRRSNSNFREKILFGNNVSLLIGLKLYSSCNFNLNVIADIRN